MAALSLLLTATALDTFAQAGGQPLILSTQSGIQSGAGGTVLQTGPLNGSDMVPARPLATLPELPQQDQQPIVVSPYIDLQQGGQTYGSPPASRAPSTPSNNRHRPSSTSSQSGVFHGVPTGDQTQAPALVPPAAPQARKPPAQPPMITPIPVAKPKSVPSVPNRSSNSRTVSGSVSTSLN